MADLAEAAGISRPALYLVYASKQEVFRAVLTRELRKRLEEAREAVATKRSPQDKLMAAFEGWSVRNYELTRSSPGAADLFACSLEFATEIANETDATFLTIIADILQPLVGKQARLDTSATALGRMMADSSRGLKASAKTSNELRASLRELVQVVVAALR